MSVIKTINLGLSSVNNIVTEVQAQPLNFAKNKFIELVDENKLPTNQRNVPWINALQIDGIQKTLSPTEIKKTVVEEKKQITPIQAPQITLNKFDIVGQKNLAQSKNDIGEDVSKYSAYELNTGISETRPAVLAMTEFKPLYRTDGSITQAKQYMDLQFFLRNLKLEDFKKIMNSAYSANVKNQVNQQYSGIFTMLNKLSGYSTLFLSVIGASETFKNAMDPRDELKSSDVQYVIDKYLDSYTQGKSLAAFIQSSHPPKYTFVDILSNLGYDKTNIQNVYSNTKVWMQFLQELKVTLRDHSSQLLDDKSVDPKLDGNSFALYTHPSTKFGLSQNQPVLIELNVLKDIQVKDVNNALNIIQNAYQNLYTPAKFFTDENKITAFLNMISKEFRYSAALAQTNTAAILQSKFNYTVAPNNNTNMFDSIIGVFGDSIASVLPSNNTSLIGFAVQGVNDKAVLTFENQYIIDGNSQLTPGVEQNIDSLFKLNNTNQFDTTNIQELIIQAEKFYEGYSVVTNQLDFVLNDPDPTNPQNIDNLQVLSNPRLLVDKIYSALVDSNGKSLPVIVNDVAASVFNLAASNLKIKSLLFLYFITKISRTSTTNIPFFSTGVSSDNSATITTIVDAMMVEIDYVLKNYHKDTNTSTDGVTTAVSIPNIKDLFITANSSLIKFIFDFLTISITELQKNNNIVINNSTRYSGHLDTAFVMSLFDFVLICINSVSKQTFLGRDNNTQKGNRYLSWQQTTTSKTSKNKVISLKNRTIKEIVITQQMIFTILGMLSSVKNASQNLVNKTQDKRVNDAINQIVTILNFDQDQLKQFFNKQQILLFSKQLNDINGMLIPEASKENSSFIIYDENVIAPGEFTALNNVYKLNYFVETEKRKQIVSVGLPQGFVSKLHLSTNTNANRQKLISSKQDDIVNISIYKIDSKNPNIIFQPQKFMFEMSRFVDVSSNRKIRNTTNPIANIGTLDIASNVTTQIVTEYLDATSGYQEAFIDESYSFLSQDQKRQLYTNHVYSHVLGRYINLVTGLSISENVFTFTPQQYSVNSSLLNMMIDQQLAAMLNKKLDDQAGLVKKNVLFQDQLELTVKNNRPFNDPIASLTREDANMMTNTLTLINDVKTLGTTFSDTTSAQLKIVTPKKFDRIFHVLLDIDGFSINKDLTESSDVGKAAFANLLNSQKISEINDNFWLKRETDEIVFDKYFVVIETDDGIAK